MTEEEVRTRIIQGIEQLQRDETEALFKPIPVPKKVRSVTCAITARPINI